MQRRTKGDTETKAGAPLPTLFTLPDAPEDLNPNISYWLTTLASDDDGEEWLDEALRKYHYYAFAKANPRHREMKPGDRICFYAAPNGVVAHATIASKTSNRIRPDTEYYPKYPWWCSVKQPRLYLKNPVEIDTALRQKLDELKTRDQRKNWGWFVQVTRKLSPHDFKLLTRSK
jgi:hypothetical protein